MFLFFNTPFNPKIHWPTQKAPFWIQNPPLNNMIFIVPWTVLSVLPAESHCPHRASLACCNACDKRCSLNAKASLLALDLASRHKNRGVSPLRTVWNQRFQPCGGFVSTKPRNAVQQQQPFFGVVGPGVTIWISHFSHNLSVLFHPPTSLSNSQPHWKFTSTLEILPKVILGLGN